MRLPRVRLTLGTLFFLIALVAANLWYYRPLYEEQRFAVKHQTSFRVPSLYLVLIPIVNVVVFGAWHFIVCRVRSFRRARGDVTSSPMAGMTFFALNFLVIAVLVHRSVPNATYRLWALLESALD